ncbi:MAG TPA: ThuA domain-containing protein [Acidobacteriaceae bacterium]|nr:ThuA domain-containing protein [Acidobacteriaceae bacterium]
MKFRCYLCLLAILFAGFLPASAKTRSSEIRVLIVDGFSNHDWQQTTLLLKGMLRSDPEFTVDVSTMPAIGSAAWRPHFADYDVVIQTCNDNNGEPVKPEWPDAVKQDFVEYVRKGGGVYIFHAAENAFVGWKAYEQMVGLSWRKADYGTAVRLTDAGKIVRIPPGVGLGTGHGQRGNVLVARLGDDPIHAGMPRAWLAPDLEVYYYARGPAEHLHVLAYARDSKPGLGMLWPVEWTTTYGKGRVYISTYGHVWEGDVQPASMRDAAVQTIIPRALEWLAHRTVTFPVPKDFPGTGTVSVRDEIPLGK